MGQIVITFAEEGEEPVSFMIPATTAAMLDQSVVDTVIPGPDGVLVPRYRGKADLFLQHNVYTLLLPVINQYANTIPAIKALQDQKAQIDVQIQAAVMPALYAPPPP